MTPVDLGVMAGDLDVRVPSGRGRPRRHSDARFKTGKGERTSAARRSRLGTQGNAFREKQPDLLVSAKRSSVCNPTGCGGRPLAERVRSAASSKLWRWRESNPRPSSSQWAFSERSRRECFRSRLSTGRGAGPQSAQLSPNDALTALFR